MPSTTPAASADEPGRRKGKRKNVTKLRDGVMKRGSTWSYVIRAKAARDEARVTARQGEYIDCNSITVSAYLDDWIESHAMEIKPRTLLDYRACIRLYVTPRIGNMPIQAVRPSTITRLYRDLLTSGGRDSRPLAVPTVTHLHAVLRKAFRDAVIVDGLIAINPFERAKRPRVQAQEPGTVWTVAQLRAFLDAARQHRLCLRSSTSLPTPEHGAVNCSTCNGRPSI